MMTFLRKHMTSWKLTKGDSGRQEPGLDSIEIGIASSGGTGLMMTGRSLLSNLADSQPKEEPKDWKKNVV
jgi:hypothetical protein